MNFDTTWNVILTLLGMTRNDMTYDQCLIEFDCDNK